MAENKELGVDDLAKFMKKSPGTVRGLLRDNKVKKSGKSYSWSNKSALQSVAKKLGNTPVAPAVVKSKKKTNVPKKASSDSMAA